MSASGPGTVLVVDDNEVGRYTKRRQLEAAGFSVAEAATGQDALIQARQGGVDLVLLDIKLPDIDGFEVCRQLRADPGTSSLAIVNITASLKRPEDHARALDTGADTYLTAPVEPAILVASVRAMLRLRRAENALREADRRKDQFLAVLAHELRNPLAPLRQGVSLLSWRADGDEPTRNTLQMMERQIAHMVRLIDDLLEVSRINQNKLQLRRTQTTLRAVIEQAVESVQAAIAQAGHQLTVSQPDGDVAIFGDSARLTQVVGNLLGNSARYTPAGGRIELDASTRGRDVVLSVRDNGIGISAEDQRHIFEMFSQARREHDSRGGGLGIGLALVRSLVQMHGGSVEVRSDGVGTGSVFTVRLPIVTEARASAAVESTPPSAPQMGSARVLVADDNHDAAGTLALLIGTMGHDVRVAHDGLEAVRIAEEFSPAIIFMDVSMPQLDGLEAARRIRRLPGGKEIRICALTGYGQHSDRARSAEAGVDTHLVKPVELPVLEQILASLS